MWRPAIQRGLLQATVLMAGIALAGLLASVIAQALIFLYVVGVLSFLGTGILLFLGGCLFSRQPLEDSKRYDAEGNPSPAWRRALLGLSLMIASVFLFLYGLLFTLVAIVFGL